MAAGRRGIRYRGGARRDSGRADGQRASGALRVLGSLSGYSRSAQPSNIWLRSERDAAARPARWENAADPGCVDPSRSIRGDSTSSTARLAFGGKHERCGATLMEASPNLTKPDSATLAPHRGSVPLEITQAYLTRAR